MKHAIGITGLILLSIFIGCSKTEDNTPAVICNNPDALNYQKNGTCTFPSDSIVGRYGVVITKYHPPCSTNDSGTNNTLIIEGGPCISHKSDSAYNVLIFYWVTPAFMPESFCVKLTDGFNFSIDSADNLLWYGAPVTGTGSFVNNKFTFNGVVQTYCGNYPLIMEGEK